MHNRFATSQRIRRSGQRAQETKLLCMQGEYSILTCCCCAFKLIAGSLSAVVLHELALGRAAC